MAPVIMNCLLLTIGCMWIGYLLSFVFGFNPQLMLLTKFLIYNGLAEKSTGGADSMVMALHNVETAPSNLEKPS